MTHRKGGARKGFVTSMQFYFSRKKAKKVRNNKRKEEERKMCSTLNEKITAALKNTFVSRSFGYLCSHFQEMQMRNRPKGETHTTTTMRDVTPRGARERDTQINTHTRTCRSTRVAIVALKKRRERKMLDQRNSAYSDGDE